MVSPSREALRLGFGFVISQSMKVVAELGIADLLADGERSVNALATASGTHAEALYRVMRLLAAEGVFHEGSPRRFSLTPVGATLRSDVPGSPRDMILMTNSEPYLAFAELLHAVRTGEPAFDKVFGKPRFDWLAANPEQGARFQRAMVALSQGGNEAVAEAYDFAAFSRVVDVGGGHGQLLSAILASNPHLSGVLFDLPAGIEAARAGVGGSLPRTELVAGSFFDAVPSGDVHVLKLVIHDWCDESATTILRNCRVALQPGGKVLLAETISPAGNEPHPVKVLDVLMLGVTGGTERTEAQYAALLAGAGLTLDRVIPTRQQISILEASAA